MLTLILTCVGVALGWYAVDKWGFTDGDAAIYMPPSDSRD